MLLLGAGAALAQKPESGSIEVAELFTWATSDPPNWGQGALYACLGFVGALVTIFGLIGGVVPGIAGKAKIEIDEKRLDRWNQRFEELISSSSPDADLIKQLEVAINNLRDDIRAEKWRQFGVAAAIYAVLGAFFSALLAQDMLQALVIGAGWTGFIGTLGLKKDYDERKTAKDAAIDGLTLKVGEMEKELKKKGVYEEKLKEIGPLLTGTYGTFALTEDIDISVARQL